jgi:dipeptidyl aminopeptidase/acylaminoacyl peptidase
VKGKLLILVILVPLGAAAYFLDRMALSYLTGQRRIPGRDFTGATVRSDGPVPGFAFLGFTRESERPPGIRVQQPFEAGREIGLKRGDVITAADGKLYRDGWEMQRDFIRHRKAGDSVSLTVVSGSEPAREVKLVLKPFLRNPGDLGLGYQEVEIRSDTGLTLRGWYVPGPSFGDGRAGVFVHGAKSSRFQALEGARYWYERGYGLLTMDLSGRGSSDGEYVTYGANERHDVRAMVRWLGERKGVSRQRVVVFGTSAGSAAAIYAVADHALPPPLALDAPYSDLWAEAREMLTRRDASPLLLYPLSWAVRWRAGFDLDRIRPIEVITQIRSPVLLIHGDADREVQPYHSERLAEARRAAGLPTERWVIPGGEHGFDNYPPAEEFWNRVMDFYDRALSGSPPGVPQSPTDGTGH